MHEVPINTSAWDIFTLLRPCCFGSQDSLHRLNLLLSCLHVDSVSTHFWRCQEGALYLVQILWLEKNGQQLISRLTDIYRPCCSEKCELTQVNATLLWLHYFSTNVENVHVSDTSHNTVPKFRSPTNYTPQLHTREGEEWQQTTLYSAERNTNVIAQPQKTRTLLRSLCSLLLQD